MKYYGAVIQTIGTRRGVVRKGEFYDVDAQVSFIFGFLLPFKCSNVQAQMDYHIDIIDIFIHILSIAVKVLVWPLIRCPLYDTISSD